MTIYVIRNGELVDKEVAAPLPHAIGLQIIKDIDSYQAVAVDVATDSAPVIGSRREHREFLKRNGYYEVGNEKISRKRQEFTPVRDDLRRAVQEVKNR